MNKGLTHVKAGDPLEIRAPIWNQMLDAARDARDRRHDASRPRSRELTGLPILIRNDSGSDLDRHEIIGITGCVFTSTDDGFFERIVLTGDRPEAGTHEGKFAVLDVAIPNGEIGRAVVDGVVACQINVTDSGHEYADISDGDSSTLASGSTGTAQILHIESGTGDQWAIVRLMGAVGGGSGGASDGRVKVDAADDLDYLEDQMRGGTSAGTPNEENVKVENINVSDDDDIMAIRHTTQGSCCCSCSVPAGYDMLIWWDANGHICSVTATPPA